MLLPAVRVQGEKGKQIDGGLEYIETVAGTDPVETAPGITALYVAPVAFALGIEPPLVGMTGNAAFIESDEHGVVIHLCLIYGQFPALIDQSLLCESAEHLPADVSLLEQISIYPPQGLVCGRQGKFLWRPFFFFLRRYIHFPLFTVEQTGHCFRVSQAVEILDKGDCMATPFCSMIIPLIPMHSNTVI